jgi:hypothetical protein
MHHAAYACDMLLVRTELSWKPGTLDPCRPTHKEGERTNIELIAHSSAPSCPSRTAHRSHRRQGSNRPPSALQQPAPNIALIALIRSAESICTAAAHGGQLQPRSFLSEASCTQCVRSTGRERQQDAGRLARRAPVDTLTRSALPRAVLGASSQDEPLREGLRAQLRRTASPTSPGAAPASSPCG